jgi:hypothetical protein
MPRKVSNWQPPLLRDRMRASGAGSIYALAKKANLTPSSVFSIYRDNNHRNLRNVLALMKALGFKMSGPEFQFLREMIDFAGGGESNDVGHGDDEEPDREEGDSVTFALRCLQAFSVCTQVCEIALEAELTSNKWRRDALLSHGRAKQKLVRQLLKNVTDDRAALMKSLFFVHGLPIADIAAAAGVHPETAFKIVDEPVAPPIEAPADLRVESLAIPPNVIKSLTAGGFVNVSQIIEVSPGRVRRLAKLNQSQSRLLRVFIRQHYKADWGDVVDGSELIVDSSMPMMLKTQLRKAGYRTLGDVVKTSPETVCVINGIGEKSMAGIREYLQRHIDPSWGVS